MKPSHCICHYENWFDFRIISIYFQGSIDHIDHVFFFGRSKLDYISIM